MSALPIAGPWLGTMRSAGSCLSWRSVWIQTSSAVALREVGQRPLERVAGEEEAGAGEEDDERVLAVPRRVDEMHGLGARQLYVRRSPNVMVGNGTPSGGCSGTDSSVVVLCARISRGQALLGDDVAAGEGGVAVHVVPVVMRVHDHDAALAGALGKELEHGLPCPADA